MDIAVKHENAAPAWGRLLAFAATVMLLLVAAFVWIGTFLGAQARGELGLDAELYLSTASMWLATGEFYYPHQFTDTFTNSGQVMLYPPVALYLLVPMSVLPRVLWWAVPLAVLAWHVWTARPQWWAWPVLAACLIPIGSAAIVVYGNTDLWIAAFLALACRYGYPAAALIIKPSVAILGLLFVRDRRAWVGAAIAAALCLPLGALWLDWFAVMANFRSAGLIYSATALPWLAIPLVAWATRAGSRAG